MGNIMMKTEDGMAVMNPDVDIKEKSHTKVTTELVKTDGAVSIAALPENDTASTSVEVSWSDLIPKMNVHKNDNLQKIVDDLCGMTSDMAETVLVDMVKSAVIDGFRILRPGQAYTMEVGPGRVQLFADKSGIIQTAQIG